MPTQKEYTDLREFLFWHLSVHTGSRPGQICDLILANFNAAKACVVEEKKREKKTCHVTCIFGHLSVPWSSTACLPRSLT